MKILYLFPAKLWNTKMSPGRRWYGKALANHPEVELKVWGLGWPGYDNGLSLEQNILESGLAPDAIWLYKPEELKGVQNCQIFKLCTYNEAWWPDQKALKEVNSYGADMVICHHHNDLKQFSGFSGELFHVPHAAPKDLFSCDTPFSGRQNASLLSGVQSAEIYPLRHRYRVLAQSGAFPCATRNHPGYRLASLEECDRQAIQYSDDLKRSKISLCCTSRYRYLLAKIIESMMAGCLVVTDAPDDPEFEQIRHYVSTIPDNASDLDIKNMINGLLADPEQSSKTAYAARCFAEDHYSTARYAERMLACIRKSL